jgi:hypothetical protein
MRCIAGAIVILAGAVFGAAGIISETQLAVANRGGGYMTAANGGMAGGAVLVVLGLVVLVTALPRGD